MYGEQTVGGTSMVELHPLGFVVTDEFGPEGRRPVCASGDDGMGFVVFHARFRAVEYAALRNRHAAAFSESGYSHPDEFDLRQACKDFVCEHGRVYLSAEEDSD